MKLKGSKADLIARWRNIALEKRAENERRKKTSLRLLAEAMAFETCAQDLEMWERDDDEKE